MIDTIIGSGTGWPEYVPFLLLLAYVYFMDGLDDDGKKCLEILEHSPSSKIRELAHKEMIVTLVDEQQVSEREESTTTTPYGNANDVTKQRKNKDSEDNITTFEM